MNRYIVKLVFNIDIQGEVHNRQFDVQLRLIFASSTQEAILKATLIGQKEEVTFLNNSNAMVNWKLIGIQEVHLLNSLDDGTEIHSSIHEDHNASEYISFVQLKTDQLKLKSNEFNQSLKSSA